MNKLNHLPIEPFATLSGLNVLLYRHDWKVEIYTPDKYFGIKNLEIPDGFNFNFNQIGLFRFSEN